MHIEDILRSMRDGEVQSDQAIAAFVEGVTEGTISRPQAAAWLAWAFQRTLNLDETLSLTRAMTHSGDVLDWGEGPPLIDKHSTGGVGDKISLILAPLWAELGYRVPMISGRGLGHTGGTLDKLEAIPGFDTGLSEARLREVLAEVGCFMNGQTSTLAPADRVLYALRNEVACVASVPLIVGSILSKKLAEGTQTLVLDVKVGSGAFMTTLAAAQVLGQTLVHVAEGYGVRCRALLTDMESPLGRAVGNANEVREAVEVLQGGGPADVRALTLALAGDPRAAEVLDSGAAFQRFERLVEAHGGDPGCLSRPDGLLGGGVDEAVVVADRGGFVGDVVAIDVAMAAFVLGAGRRRAEDPVDPGVGVEVLVRRGDVVEVGQPLARLSHRSGHALDEAIERLRGALPLVDAPLAPRPLILERLGA